jgi:hypothetical protein
MTILLYKGCYVSVLWARYILPQGHFAYSKNITSWIILFVIPQDIGARYIVPLHSQILLAGVFWDFVTPH